MIGYFLKNTLSDFGSVSRAVCEHDADYILKDIVEYLKITRSGEATENISQSVDTQILSLDTIVSMNMWRITPKIFDFLRKGFPEFLEAHSTEQKSEYLFASVIGIAMQENKITVQIIKSKDAWFGVRYPQDKARVEDNIARMV